jgi:hypothetical protein
MKTRTIVLTLAPVFYWSGGVLRPEPLYGHLETE